MAFALTQCAFLCSQCCLSLDITSTVLMLISFVFHPSTKASSKDAQRFNVAIQSMPSQYYMTGVDAVAQPTVLSKKEKEEFAFCLNPNITSPELSQVSFVLKRNQINLKLCVHTCGMLIKDAKGKF